MGHSVAGCVRLSAVTGRLEHNRTQSELVPPSLHGVVAGSTVQHSFPGTLQVWEGGVFTFFGPGSSCTQPLPLSLHFRVLVLFPGTFLTRAGGAFTFFGQGYNLHARSTTELALSLVRHCRQSVAGKVTAEQMPQSVDFLQALMADRD